jgi:serine/threonine protein kinase
VHQAIEWASQIAEGLKAAHGKNIVHRDIKPENVMLTNEGKLKIMDFGIAKLKSSSGLTRTGTSLGTLSYMSPEQAQGEAADQRSDIWSLGVVLYELLTADLPFKSEHEAGLLYLIVNEDPPVPSLMDRKIPHQVDGLIKKMLAKNRAQRFQSMDEVLHSLQDTRRLIESVPAQPQAKAIAVLPFGNISPDKESDYFSDGLTEELIINLSKRSGGNLEHGTFWQGALGNFRTTFALRLNLWTSKPTLSSGLRRTRGSSRTSLIFKRRYQNRSSMP